jgi:predicted small integral membrane protein
MIRLLKSFIVLSAAMLCIFYASNNVANINSMFGVMSYVLGNQDHVAYPNAFGPAVTMPALIWIAIAIVLIGEFGAGLLALKGSWDMFRARGKSADEFQAAKTTALIACLIGILTWYGVFMGIGGAYFQMWQTEIGTGSHDGAFQFAAMLGIIFLIVNSRDN